MADANITPNDFKEESRDGKVRLLGTYTGFIKDNQDNQRNGRLRVYIPELGGDPTKEANWHLLQYASPFAGATNLSTNKDGDKTMMGSQISYGFWAIPPDLDNQVLCCFANGDLAQGFWFACVYQENMNHMIPGVANGISTKDDINKINLPVVSEYNKKDKDVTKNAGDPKRPIFEPLHNGLTAQGLYADPERGPATTSARREAPSQVFGLISPRSNTIHIDDNPKNEVIRLRTRSGVQLVISETTGFIYMNSKQGNSWFELSDIGIDMYSKRSISMRAEENINLHADQSIIMHSGGGHHASGGSMTENSSGGTQHKAGGSANHKGGSVSHNSKNKASAQQTKAAQDKLSAQKDVNAANATQSNGKGITPNQQTAMNYFIGQGYTPAQAAGIVAGLSGESTPNLNTGAQGSTSTENGGVLSNAAFGIANWNGSRQQDLLDYANSTGQDVNALSTQLGFVNSELNGKYTTALSGITSAGSSQDALSSFVVSYEISADQQGDIVKRSKFLSALQNSVQ